MTALDELQRTLARAVDAGAASDPAGAGAVAGRQRFAGLRRRRGWHMFFAILLAGGATTGALAATGQLRIVKTPAPEYSILAGPEGPKLTPINLRILPMRIKDPTGGPPWTLRVFELNGQTACVQLGQVYQGHFGRVSSSPRIGEAFRPIPPVPGGMASRCGLAHAGGFPIVRGVREQSLSGGPQSDGRCPTPRDAADRCPISAVRVIRFGLLGPEARSASFRHSGGRARATQELSKATGGAYLFAEAVDPALARRAAALEAGVSGAIDARYPRVRYGTIPKPARAAADREWRKRTEYAARLHRASRRERQLAWTAQAADETVEATFTGGTTRVVAGHRAQSGSLPGVLPVTRPRRIIKQTAVRAEYFKQARSVKVSFAAPVAIDRFAEYYLVTIRGSVAPACGRHVDSAQRTMYRAPNAGETIVTRVRAPWNGRNTRPTGWCPGKPYTVRVKHHLGPFGQGHGVEQAVGETTFVAR